MISKLKLIFKFKFKFNLLSVFSNPKHHRVTLKGKSAEIYLPNSFYTICDVTRRVVTAGTDELRFILLIKVESNMKERNLIIKRRDTKDIKSKGSHFGR